MVTYITPDNVGDCLERLEGNSFWVPVMSDRDRHFVLNRISSMYIYSMDTDEEYIVSFHNVDLESVDSDSFFNALPGGDRIAYNARYMPIDDRKEFGFQERFSDADMVVWYHNGSSITLDDRASTVFDVYKRMYPKSLNIHDVVPIMRILEYGREVRNYYIQHSPSDPHAMWKYYDDVHRKTLDRISRAGIFIDPDIYEEHYNRQAPGNVLYTEFNPYTITGRPSCKFGGINFNSLSKTSGVRNMIVSRFEHGRLFELDYDSYHVRLIADMVGYEFPEGNIHEYLAKQYFGTPKIDEDQYAKSKSITFRQMYGGVEDKYKHIEFYKSVSAYIEGLWESYNTDGYIESPNVRRRFHSTWYDPDNMSKTKLFSYIMQCHETEVNMVVLEEILQYLYQKKTKIIMYTYDAIVIDHYPPEGKEVIERIAHIMSRRGYPVNMKVGVNYGDMVDVTI